MKPNDVFQLGYRIASAKCSTPEACAELNRDLCRYGHANAAMMFSLLTGEDCPDLIDKNEVNQLQGGIAKRRAELEAPIIAARKAEQAAGAIAREAEQVAEDERRKALGPTLIQKNLLARGWTKKQIRALGPPDYVVERKSWNRRWCENHYSVSRVEQAETFSAIASAS